MSGYYFAVGSGGGGSVTYNQHVIANEFNGPVSYPTGGFTIDLSKTYSSLNYLDMVVKTQGANLPAYDVLVTLNSPSAGRAQVRVMRKRYDRTSTIGNVQNQPVGVTVLGASGGTASSESAHTHSINHDHPAFNTGNNTNAGAGVLSQPLGGSIGTHQHSVDIPTITATSGAGTAHNHTDNSLYAHSHANGHTATNLTAIELPNATDLSGTVWYLMASGIKL